VSEGTQRIRDDSDQLLEGLRELKRLEEAKRSDAISTPAFHDKAERVESAARQLYRIAQEETDDGNAVSTQRVTTEDVEPGRD
jgi:hypothetical protein